MRRGKRGSEGARSGKSCTYRSITVEWIILIYGSTWSMDKVLTLKARTKCSVYGSQFQR